MMTNNKKSIAALLFLVLLWSGMTSVVAAGEKEKNVAVVHRIYEQALNKGNLNVIDEVISVDFVDHEEVPGIPPSREGLKQAFAMYRTAFPDLTFKVEDIIAKGDKVWVRYSVTGTHKADFMGVPASGKKIQVHGFDVMRFVNGKAVEHWGLFDSMTMMQQLGAIPTAEQEKKIGFFLKTRG